MDRLPYAKQNITQEDSEAVLHALKRTVITRGEIVDEFEKTVAAYCGASYAVAFNSGTSALHACYAAVQSGPADRLFTTPNTFVGTVVGGMKGSCHFIDIERETGNVSLFLLQEKINSLASRGKDIIVPVHFAGIPVDMRRLSRMITSPETIVIEDAAHALGSVYPSGEKVGSCTYSHLTVFSFHPAKQITTGEGGMALTNDPHLYARLKEFRNNGIVRSPDTFWSYEIKGLSGNYNFTDFQAALGLSQFQRLSRIIEKRRSLTALYREKFSAYPFVRLFKEPEEGLVSPHLFVVQVDFKARGVPREEVMRQLKQKGIGTQFHYLPLYRLLQKQAECPEMERYAEEALSLPLHTEMDAQDVEEVVSSFLRIIGGK